jgi:alkylhydroperoxidase/carboxymuconolactone decarboxylase family protein YurZ
MSDEPVNKSYGWADEIFSNQYEIDPKYRDMLAMLAAAMKGEPDAAQHFYERAQVDGASEEELRRIAQIVRPSQPEVEAPTTSAQSE